jgi:threonine dehydratase
VRHDAVVDLSLDGIERAAASIDPVFLDSPQFPDSQLSAAVGRDVLVKVETLNPIGSFKGRGAHWLVAGLESSARLVCATAGNFGQGVAHAGRARGMPVHVFMDERANPVKVARLRALGAEVVIAGADVEGAKRAALEHVDAHPGSLFVEDGEPAAIAEGAGTIGRELLRDGPFDTIVVQVGDGALLTGVARWVKAHAPGTSVVGVCAGGAPAMERSWRERRPVSTPEVDTIADALAIASPVPASLERVLELADDFVLVDDADMLAAMRLVAETVGVVCEPAGAAGVAALMRHDLPGSRVAVLLTGSGPRPEDLAAALIP